MNKKGQVGLGVIIMIFIAVILGIALFIPIINTSNQMTSKQDISNQSVSTVDAWVNANDVNESINFTIYTQSDWKKLECSLGSVAIRNGAGTALTKDTDYLVYADEGVFSLLNTTKTIPTTALNLSYVDYNYCADGYNTSSGSRSIIGIILIFTALAIFASTLPGVKEWISG